VHGGALVEAPRFRTRGLDFERPLHREMARATGRLARAAAVAERRRGGRSARQRGSRSPARPPGHWGAGAQARTMRLGCSPPGAGLGWLRNDGRRRRREVSGGGKLGFRRRRRSKAWRLGLGWRRVGGPGGAAQLIKARESLLGVRAKQGGYAPGQGGRESDSALSPARPRVRDDRRGPPVIGCGAARAG
jgi:hypothetical protein